MTVDAILAILHHLAAFGLVALLVAEIVVVRGRLDAEAIRRFGRLDAMYGAAAGIVIAAGIGRLLFGVVPAEVYLSNAFFWLKMGSLAAVALASIHPTILGIRWRRALAGAPDYEPPSDESRAMRRTLVIEAAILPIIPISAALMARGFGTL
jgi:putative membrane protein